MFADFFQKNLDKPENSCYNKNMKIKILKNGEIHTYGDAITAGDFHHPLQDDFMVDAVMEEAIKFRITMLIINGDLLNADNFSRFDEKQKTANWDLERAAIRRTMDKFQQWFKWIIWNRGNHDAHPLRATKYILSMDDIARILIDRNPACKIYTTDRDYVIHNDEIRICHPHEYSGKPGYKAKKIGEKYGMSTIVGHTHMLNKVETTKDGQTRYYIDGGHCCNQQKVEYNQIATTTYSSWIPGFVRIQRRIPYIVNPYGLKPRVNTVERRELY